MARVCVCMCVCGVCAFEGSGQHRRIRKIQDKHMLSTRPCEHKSPLMPPAAHTGEPTHVVAAGPRARPPGHKEMAGHPNTQHAGAPGASRTHPPPRPSRHASAPRQRVQGREHSSPRATGRERKQGGSFVHLYDVPGCRPRTNTGGGRPSCSTFTHTNGGSTAPLVSRLPSPAATDAGPASAAPPLVPGLDATAYCSWKERKREVRSARRRTPKST